ncbi:MAG: 16S rRNA (guanine(527)-N(7))-methyltransferase RsmG [Pseudomonadales bacterium]|nr:16S rRNA (guanine(527)-N(7))-methyltransferase RsmG [Pseudomonadales bacterium]
MPGLEPATLARQLSNGLQRLGLDLDAAKQSSLLAYLALLVRWNQAFNLSGVKEPERMVSLHLLDSLSIAPFVAGHRVLDVGTGAGLPGIPLAIAFPEKKFVLLDSNGKKTRFLFQAVTALGLDNVDIVNERAENFQSQDQIDIVVTRAFSSLNQSIRWTAHLFAEHGCLLAMKGLYPEAEVMSLLPGYTVRNTYALSLPEELEQRHLLEIVAGQESVGLRCS